MDTIWNDIDLKIPPLITIRVADGNFVKQARSIFLKRKSTQNDVLQDEFAKSAALLSRLMARRKNSFRNMSGFKFVSKLNAALGRLLKVDVEQSLNNFFQMLPDVDSVSHNEVPSRNSLDYILLRIISVHRLYQRIIFCCTQSADYFTKLLKNNFFMETITLFLAVIAKIWNLSHKFGNIYCGMYTRLITLRNCFPQMNSNNHFKDFNFPKQLDGFSMRNVDEANFNSNDVVITMHKEATQPMPIATVPVLSQGNKSQDIGMAVSRDSLKPLIDLSRIHNIDDIRRYFKEEDEKRAKSLKSCATKCILKHEWLAIQKLVERKIIANDHKKALSIFRKFITSKT